MKLFTAAVYLFLASSLVGCAATTAKSSRGLETSIERVAVKFSSDLQVGGYRIVTTDELQRWVAEEREIIIISTLPPAEELTLGIIPGSLEAVMPKSENELTPEDREHMLRAAGSDKQRTMVVYCSFLSSRRSHIGAKMLVDLGYKNVYRYPAGIAGWREAVAESAR